MLAFEVMRARALVAVTVLAATAAAASDCGQSAAPAPTSGCTELAPSCSAPTPSFLYDVKPLLDRSCNSTCHAPGVGPWPLGAYQDVADWASLIQLDLEACTMPPPDAGPPLTDAERQKVLDWIACGAPADPPSLQHAPTPIQAGAP